MAEKTKAVVDAEIRAVGIAKIDTSELTHIVGGTFLHRLPNGRYVEIKVTAKSEKFTDEDFNALLDERALVEKTKAEKAAPAAKKKAADEKKRKEKEA